MGSAIKRAWGRQHGWRAPLRGLRCKRRNSMRGEDTHSTLNTAQPATAAGQPIAGWPVQRAHRCGCAAMNALLKSRNTCWLSGRLGGGRGQVGCRARPGASGGQVGCLLGHVIGAQVQHGGSWVSAGRGPAR